MDSVSHEFFYGCCRLAPKLVTMVEQDLSLAGSFLGRFVKEIHYYSALFDSLGASYGEESEEQHVVEQQLLSREIRNVLAVGGPSRSGEVKLHQRNVTVPIITYCYNLNSEFIIKFN
ncbi:hypothetical protein SLEP1_g19547 [Rubroshorea leprosula]|uniref:Spindle pole body component n=1 Tax=Rubroshorea leprosula TaxID=152421 RepID=A0AAV5J7C5_9ROSI|nr:hypothetical protein SLEP1_g19547 [Rubroshorea leprosula]